MHYASNIDPLLIFSFFTASILFITDVMLDADDDPLSVTVSVNELCPSDRDYGVLVTFGTRPGAGSDSDCRGQVDVNTTISSGDSATLSVSADTVDRESNEVYCFVARVNDIPTPAGCDCGDESEGLSTGATVGITVALTLLVALPVGVVIGVCVSWCVWKSFYGQHYEAKQKKLQGANAAAIYEDPEATGVRETAIPLSHNQAYGQVDLQGRRGN